jgi:phage-related protein
MNFVRQVVAYKRYFVDFYRSQPDQVQKKIEWVLNLIRLTEIIPEKFFKHIEGTRGLYEIRIDLEGNTYRIFSFFDKGSIIVLGNAFQKKTRKIPVQEITRAIKIMEDYFNEKKEYQ